MKFLFFSSAVWDYYQRLTPLCAELARLGHTVVFVEPIRYAGALPAHLDPSRSTPVPPGVQVVRRQSALRRGVSLALLQNMRNLHALRQHKPDVAVLSDVAFGLAPALYLRFSRTKAVLDYIDDWPEWSRVPWERWTLRHILVPTVARLADVCTVTAERLGDDLRRHARRVAYVPNGTADPPPPLDEDAFHGGSGVLYVGGLTDRIDVALLVELARQMPNVPVTALGDGPQRGCLREAARCVPNLHAPGPVPHEEAMQAIRTAAVCLVPYVPSRLTDRCFPIKLAEYWACGKAVVASDTHEVRRVGEGRLRIYQNASEAVAAVQSLLNNPQERATLGKAGYEAVRDCYNYRALALRFLSAACDDDTVQETMTS